MAKGKKSTQGELPSRAAEPARQIPALLEYLPVAGDEKWRVEKFSDLAAEFQFDAARAEEQMAMFHELAQGHTRQWQFLRQLFGIHPLLIPDNAALEDFATLTRAQLCERHGLEKNQLQAELDAIRAMWGDFLKRSEPEQEAASATPNIATEARTELGLDEGEAVLRDCGFPEKMFEGVMVFDPEADPKVNPSQIVKRDPEKNRAERDWFISRCEECRPMFREPGARTTVREMLYTELQLSRLQDEMATLTPGMPKYEKLDKLKTSIWDRYQTQLDKLESMFPDLNLAGRVTFRQVISTVIGAERDFYGDQNNKRRDALFTAAEIQVLMRRSIQNPEAQYRLSLSMLVTEAVHGLYDRNFRSTLAGKPTLLKKIDAAVKAAIKAAQEAQNEPLVDLEAGVTPVEGDNFDELIEFEATEAKA